MTTERRRIGLLTGAIVVLALGLRTLPQVLLGGLLDRGPPAWLPTFGTLGETVVLYSYGFEILGPLLVIVLAVGFGYVLGQRIEFDRHTGPLVRSMVIGATVPPVLVGVAWSGWSMLGSFDPISVAIAIMFTLQLLVLGSLPVLVGTVAGIALAHVADSTGPPTRGDDESISGPAPAE